MDLPCYDVIVLGAGAAGATCAALAARRGLRAAFIDPVDSARQDQPRPEWTTRPVLSILDELEIDKAAFVDAPVSGAVFHSADLGRTAEANEQPPPAFRIDYGRLTQAIVERAIKSGVRSLLGVAPGQVQVGERAVTVRLRNGEAIEGRFLVLATGTGKTAKAGEHAEGRWLAEFQGRIPRTAGDDRLHWVLGREGIVWWQVSDHLVVHLWATGSAPEVAARLRDFVGEACAARVLAATIGDAAISIRPRPAVSALEMDSLVDKGTLRIGDAGGFLSVASMEGIYPAMWSAKFAVQVLAEAVRSPQPQDTLQSFDRLWRTAMAEYLRPPDIEAAFLVPLVFSNRQMAARLASAFWRGQRTG